MIRKIKPALYVVKVFEEFVGLLGSGYYLTNSRLNEFHHLIRQSSDLHQERILKLLKQKNKINFLDTMQYMSDSNQKRRISHLYLLEKDGVKLNL
jgi:hypothetical protein